MALEMRTAIEALTRNGACSAMTLGSGSALRMDLQRWGPSDSRVGGIMPQSGQAKQQHSTPSDIEHKTSESQSEDCSAGPPNRRVAAKLAARKLHSQ
jgi:hypothetical protein